MLQWVHKVLLLCCGMPKVVGYAAVICCRCHVEYTSERVIKELSEIQTEVWQLGFWLSMYTLHALSLTSSRLMSESN